MGRIAVVRLDRNVDDVEPLKLSGELCGFPDLMWAYREARL
jgi:hypothetical protein